MNEPIKPTNEYNKRQPIRFAFSTFYRRRFDVGDRRRFDVIESTSFFPLGGLSITSKSLQNLSRKST